MSDHHDHADTRRTSRVRVAVAFGITASILVAELIGAALTGSLALLVDAAHMSTDSAGLLIALIASTLALRSPSARRSWGYARAEVLAATLQAAVLIGVGIFVVVEAVQRLFEPPEIPATGLLIFGIVGLLGNLASIAVLFSGRDANFNLRAAFLEVVNDALGSVGVIVAAAVITFTGWQSADAIAALLIGALIIPRAVRLLRQTTSVLLESTPAGVDVEELRRHLLELPYVRDVHDLHVSQIASQLPVLTAHIVADRECFRDDRAPQLLGQLQACVAAHFEVKIEHSTFQIEPDTHQEREHLPHT